MDKKLILKTENLVINTRISNQKTSIKDIQQLLSNLEYILFLFDKVEIKELKINDNLIIVDLDKNHLFVDNKYINVSSNLKVENSVLDLNLYSIYLKDTGLTLLGDIKIDLKKDLAVFLGEYIYKNIEGKFNANVQNEIFEFYIDTNKQIDSLGFLKDFFRLDSVAEEWMYDNVEGKIKLNYLSGKIDLKKQLPIMDSIEGQAVIENAKIRFHKDVKTVDTPKLTVNYKNDTLSFDLEKPMYEKSKLYGSRVYITNLTSLKKGIVHVDLKSDSMLNKNILEILKAYQIKLPVKQFSGTLSSKLLLEIPYEASRKMHAYGDFKAQKAQFKLGNFEFFASSADVVLKDNNVIIEKSHVSHDDMLDADLTLNIDTKTSMAKGEAKVNSFRIKKGKDEIVSLKDFDTNINIDFNKKTVISLEKLKTTLTLNDDALHIDIPEVSVIYPYSSLLKQIDIKDANLKIDIYNENRIGFDIKAKNLNYPFEKDGKKIKNLAANGVLQGDKTSIQTKNGDISVILEKDKNPLLKLKNIDLVLPENEGKSNKSYPNIDIDLQNSMLKLDKEHIYKTSWAKLNIQNSKLSFEGEGLDLELPVSKEGKKVTKLLIEGTYENNLLKLNTKDNKLKLDYNIPNERIDMVLNGYDVIYNTEDSQSSKEKTDYYIKGKNSNIIINEKHIAKAKDYNFIFEKENTEINLNYGSISFLYKKDAKGNIILDAKNMDDEFLNALLGKELIKGGKVNLIATGKDDKITGYATFNETKIVDLAILNNLIILINTSPAIINPLLAIPSVVGMATNGGFNLNGYRITQGRVDFSYDFKNKYLDMNRIYTEGNGIDFDGNMTIDFNSSKVDAKLKLVFFKDYSKIVGYIPVINYMLLGDENRVDTEVTIYGTLDDPKYKTNLIEEGVSAPVNFLKRVITSPLQLFKSFGSSDEEEEKKE